MLHILGSLLLENLKPKVLPLSKEEIDFNCIFTGRNEVVAKVMFLQVCVCPRGGGCLPQCMLGCHALPPGSGRPHRDQADPLGPGSPPGTRQTPTPLTRQTPPGSRLQHMVRILLECILVVCLFWGGGVHLTGPWPHSRPYTQYRVPEWPVMKSWHFPWYKGQRVAHLERSDKTNYFPLYLSLNISFCQKMKNFLKVVALCEWPLRHVRSQKR